MFCVFLLVCVYMCFVCLFVLVCLFPCRVFVGLSDDSSLSVMVQV